MEKSSFDRLPVMQSVLAPQHDIQHSLLELDTQNREEEGQLLTLLICCEGKNVTPFTPSGCILCSDPKLVS